MPRTIIHMNKSRAYSVMRAKIQINFRHTSQTEGNEGTGVYKYAKNKKKVNFQLLMVTEWVIKATFFKCSKDEQQN